MRTACWLRTLTSSTTLLTVNVVFEDGNEYDGNVLGVDERADLAIVKLRADRKFSAMGLGNSDDVDVGDEVIALGFPLSYELGSSLTVTRGIISAKRYFRGCGAFSDGRSAEPGKQRRPPCQPRWQSSGRELRGTSDVRRKSG